MLLTTAYMPFNFEFFHHSESPRNFSKGLKMSTEFFLPQSDVMKLTREVLSRPPILALPRNLSDEWLDQIGRDLGVYFGEMDADAEYEASSYLTAPLALLMHLLSGKTGAKKIKIELGDVDAFLNVLRAEINLELIHRRTNMRIVGATMDTIFNDREVLFRLTSSSFHQYSY